MSLSSPIPTDPTQIHSVTFLQNGIPHKRVIPDTTVDIVCDFDPGNPKNLVTPRLTREDGTDLEAEIKANPHRLVHNIHSVTCRDAGNVTCHGFGQPKSAQLIVDCKCVWLEAGVRFEQLVKHNVYNYMCPSQHK